MNQLPRLPFNDVEYEVLEADGAIPPEDLDRLKYYLILPKPVTVQEFAKEFSSKWLNQNSGGVLMNAGLTDPAIVEETNRLVLETANAVEAWLNQHKEQLALLAQEFQTNLTIPGVA